MGLVIDIIKNKFDKGTTYKGCPYCDAPVSAMNNTGVLIFKCGLRLLKNGKGEWEQSTCWVDLCEKIRMGLRNAVKRARFRVDMEL